MNEEREALRAHYIAELDRLVVAAEKDGFYATVEREVLVGRRGTVHRYYLLDMRDAPSYYRNQNAKQD